MVNRCSLCKKERLDAQLVPVKEEEETKYYCRGKCLDQKIAWDNFNEEEL